MSSYPSDPGPSWNPPSGRPGGGELVPAEDRNWALAAHIGSFVTALFAFGFVAPLAVLLVRGNQSPFVRRHAVESLNFQITTAVVYVVCLVLAFVLIGFLLLPILGVVYLVAVVLATVAASQGREFRYPLTVRLIS